jgi:hypothetical protein
MTDQLLNYDRNWTTDDGLHDGGVSTGFGFTISWQRGPAGETGRNGAFLIDVLRACREQLHYFEYGDGSRPVLFSCTENRQALNALDHAISQLAERRSRRAEDGTLGTHTPDFDPPATEG